jgi:hypothetical protein
MRRNSLGLRISFKLWKIMGLWKEILNLPKIKTQEVYELNIQIHLF